MTGADVKRQVIATLEAGVGIVWPAIKSWWEGL